MRRHLNRSVAFLLVLLTASTSTTSAQQFYAREGRDIGKWVFVNESIMQCQPEEDELLMDSDVSRRFLAENKKRMLGNEALKKNNPVSGDYRPGQAYNIPNRPCESRYECKKNIPGTPI